MDKQMQASGLLEGALDMLQAPPCPLPWMSLEQGQGSKGTLSIPSLLALLTVGLLGHSSLQTPWRLHQCWGAADGHRALPQGAVTPWGATAIVGLLGFAVGRSPKAHARGFWDVISWETWACWASKV